MSPPRIVVVGAGVGGLTTAAVLARAGLHVTVLEAHIHPGGCAGTFHHKGYRFDAGATLAGGFYPGGPMDRVAAAAGIARWPARPAEPCMMVHLPGGDPVTRFGGEERFGEHRRAFGASGDAFWRWQERTADAMWDLAQRGAPWPPQTMREAGGLLGAGLRWLRADAGARLDPTLLADAFRPVAAHLEGAPERLRRFVDAQLLISAQTTSDRANALYGAAALDLPRRGVVHLEGGIGTLSEELARALREHGGTIHYRQQVDRIVVERGRPAAVATRRGRSFAAEAVVADLSPWNVARMLGEAAPARLRALPPLPADAWGAFVVYVGLDGSLSASDLPLHHQVVVREPPGEGNTLFLSLSPPDDASRAPAGRRAMTISTHTRLDPWWEMFAGDRHAYARRKQDYCRRILDAAETAIPGLRDAAELVLPGTPVTFERFTRRVSGWVGGFPQTGLFRTWAPQLAPGLWMVGDSIFPGQSTAAVALGGLRVAESVLAAVGGRRGPGVPGVDAGLRVRQ